MGEYCAEALLDASPRPTPQYVKLFGPRFYSSLDVKKAIEEVTGREGTMVTIPPEGLAEYFAKELPAEYVQEFVEFMKAQLSGGIIERDYGYGEDTILGKVELVDGLRDIASS